MTPSRSRSDSLVPCSGGVVPNCRMECTGFDELYLLMSSEAGLVSNAAFRCHHGVIK